MPIIPRKTTPKLKEAMLAALEKHLGIVTPAAKTAGIDRGTHYDWLKNDPEYAAAVKALENATIDFAESALLQQMKSGNATSTIFYLKTKGKHRGYVEQHEIKDVTEAPRTFIIKSATDEGDKG